MIYYNERQSWWVFPICVVASMLLNFFIASGFPVIFKAQQTIKLPELVEVDMQLSEEEPEQPSSNIAHPANTQDENQRLSELLKNLPSLTAPKPAESFASSSFKMKENGPKEQIPADFHTKAVDKSGEFKQNTRSPSLADNIDLANLSQRDYKGFESVAVPLPKQKVAEIIAQAVVQDKGGDFKTKQNSTLSINIDGKKDVLLDLAALRAQLASVPSENRISGQGVNASLISPIGKRTIVHSENPNYPDWAKKKNLEAIIVIKFSVLPSGLVSDQVFVVQTSGYTELDESAMNALRRWRFNDVSKVSAEVQWGQIAFQFKL